MTSTDLATLANNPVALNKAFGFEGRPKPLIPILKIEGSDDEEGVNKAPKGNFVYDDGDRLLYADEIFIRSFVKAYQYRLFDNKKPDNKDVSIIAPSFKVDFISSSGRIACGKLSKKVFDKIAHTASTEQKYFQENVKCKLLVFGVLSGNFVDVDTKEKVTVTDVLFSWVVPQCGFMDIDRTINSIDKERRAVALTPIRIRLNKEKNGTVTYYIPVPSVEPRTVSLVAERDGGYLGAIRDFVKANNDYVTEKYNAAVNGKAQDTNFGKVGKTIDTKAEFIDDPLDM